jgi:hypothetical protein
MTSLLLAALCMVPNAGQSNRKTESFWDKLLRVTGISATPASLRGEEHVTSGDIWVVVVSQTPSAQRLTRDGGYRSPVFDAQARNVLALKGSDLYRVPMNGDPPARLHGLTGVSKLVGLSSDGPDELLVLGNDDRDAPYAAMVSIRTGALTRIPHNPASSDDRVMLAHLAGWERVYGNTRVYTETTEREGAGGTAIEFTDVYLKRGSDPPVNLTHGTTISSSQPSLSPDGRQVVFIRAVDERRRDRETPSAFAPAALRRDSLRMH